MPNEINAGIVRDLLDSEECVARRMFVGDILKRKKVYIYGAGNAGVLTFLNLQSQGVDVEAFFDLRGSEGQSCCGRPVFLPASCAGISDKEASVVIVAFFCGQKEFDDIRGRLSEWGWENIIYFHGLRLIFESPSIVIKTAGLLEDDASCDVFNNYLKALIYERPGYFSAPSGQPQYFDPSVPLVKNTSRFIDCGAFDGDTARDLKRIKGEVEAIAFFEPDGNNVARLSSNLKNERFAKEQILFPCGVWNKCEILKFRSGLQTTSGLADSGDTSIQCVAIDDVIPDFSPTFIKMDIEGAECEALEGARKTISRCAPDMAVSVYHKLEHLWNVPGLLLSMCPDYRFYLRSYGINGLETILYAVCP
ncbi:MAG: hypothetical protein A2020_07320 [Lentisphaerae bacterium GWF2_45_14]|nr:MAG: hypothetical protein A2020_07320 [Lentisphaerae bacterium GWF2_45_14]